MSVRNIRRGASVAGVATPTSAPIYVDSDNNKLMLVPAGSGSTEYEITHEGAAANLKGGLAGADTAALVAGGGTSTTPLSMGSTAGQNLLGWWATTASVTGDERLLYTRLYFTGAGVSGECARIFASVSDVAAATVRGMHCSLSFGSTGSVTGLGVAAEFTLHIPSGGGLAGTVSPIKTAINADGAASDPVGSVLSHIQCVNQGDATGDDDTDTDAHLLHIQGHAIGNGNMIEAVQTGYELAEWTHGIKIRIGSDTYWIPISNLAPSAT